MQKSTKSLWHRVQGIAVVSALILTGLVFLAWMAILGWWGAKIALGFFGLVGIS